MIFTGCRKTGQLDLEAVETLARGSMHRAGALILGRLLSVPAAQTSPTPCACGHTAGYHDTRSRQLLTMLGPVEFQRGYFVCPQCRQGQSPRDRELDVEGTEFSPGVRRMMAAVGAEASFEQGCEQLELLAGLAVTSKAVERAAEAIGTAIEAGEQEAIRRTKQLELPEVCAPAVPVFYLEMDGTGVPVNKKEREGRTGKTEGQPARTREVKLGCVFTQTTTDEEGRPVRDEGSTSYVASIEPAEAFGLRLYTEAWRRGWSKARRKVVLGDGAIWIWNLADQHFLGAIQIADLYQARKQWTAICLDQLNEGKIEALVKSLRALHPSNEKVAEAVHNDADYF